MAEQLLFVAGLPGCGKTTYLSQLCRQGWIAFDDFKNKSYGSSSEFRASRKFRSLWVALKDRLECAVADIDFCCDGSRDEAEQILRDELPEVAFAWRFFARDMAACEANIRSRNRPSQEQDLAELRKYARMYTIPTGAIVMPVVSEGRGGPTKG